ncbi:hypothetical protein [Caballeronia sordidicola]|uniref:hypothetical protein n=1 Tax=Caballeronia sordidicola TaxID=196367 RepID=UPI00117EA3C8|nr:hypothetical protein [Caballeronia sordidicola]
MSNAASLNTQNLGKARRQSVSGITRMPSGWSEWVFLKIRKDRFRSLQGNENPLKIKRRRVAKTGTDLAIQKEGQQAPKKTRRPFNAALFTRINLISADARRASPQSGAGAFLSHPFAICRPCPEQL